MRQPRIEGSNPSLSAPKVKDGAHVYSKALMVAFGVHASGRREVIGIEVAESEAEAGWPTNLGKGAARTEVASRRVRKFCV